MSAQLISSLYRIGLWRRKSRFLRSLKSPQAIQDRLQRRLVNKLANTDYGRLFNVRPDDNYESFAKKVPIVSYDHIRHLIERQRNFDRPILTADPILSFERTSPFGKSKFVPITRDLRQSFYNAYALTLSDMLSLKPNLKSGKTYLKLLHRSLESEYALLPESEKSSDKFDYLDSFFGKILRKYMVVPQKVNALLDQEDFLHVTSLYLLSEPHLEIISILNPSHLELLLDFMQNEAQRLVPQLLRGRVTVDGLSFEFEHISAERAGLLMAPPYDWSKVWPNLQVISCFTSGQSQLSVNSLKRSFPNVPVHSKGLLATEAPLTVRLEEAMGYVPCLEDVFFEFMDDDGKIHLISSLEVGKEYDVIISQLSGLYRYRIGDRVRVTHHYKKTPCIEFVGKSSFVSDIAGEKLNDAHARKCIEKFFYEKSTFSVLVPHHIKGEPPRYFLVTNQTGIDIAKYAKLVDEALCAAFHYRNARLNGRLDEVKIKSHPYARELFIRYYSDKGMPVDDAHSCVLLNEKNKAREFLDLLAKEP